MSLRVPTVLVLFVGAGCFLEPGDPDLQGGMGASGGENLPANAYCDAVAEWHPEDATAEERVRELVNEARAAGGMCGAAAYGPTAALVMNGALRCAARVHSLDMADRNFFDHLNPDRESPSDRIGKTGYVFFTAGENIAAGQATPEEVVTGWLQSPGHCANILSPDFLEIGVGYVMAPDAAYPHYWTQTFGAR